MKPIDTPLRLSTSLKLGGRARSQYIVESDQDWPELLKQSKDHTQGLKILGGGANLLISDQTFDALVVKLLDQSCTLKGSELIVSAGCPIIKAVLMAAKASLTGLEWATAVPGTWGGALTMNAGAYGSDTSQNVVWADVITYEGKIERVYHKDIQWMYRHTHWPIEFASLHQVCLQLEPGDLQTIKAKQSEIQKQRSSKFPRSPCAGSTFKNPEGLSAGKLIEECGLKGRHFGQAMISERHANIFINRGESSQDFIDLISWTRKKVRTETGVDLEPEVVLWHEKDWATLEAELNREPKAI